MANFPLYKTARWRDLRAAQLAREPLCKLCLERGVVMPATVCDHVERHGGDPVRFWAGPFASLCKACHDGAKRQEELHGFRRDVDAFGWPTDERHPANRVKHGA
jgi:hypothetical protein